jgi:hypothetical protein
MEPTGPRRARDRARVGLQANDLIGSGRCDEASVRRIGDRQYFTAGRLTGECRFRCARHGDRDTHEDDEQPQEEQLRPAQDIDRVRSSHENLLARTSAIVR